MKYRQAWSPPSSHQCHKASQKEILTNTMAVTFSTDLEQNTLSYLHCLPQERFFRTMKRITCDSQYCKSGRRNTVEKFHYIKTLQDVGKLNQYIIHHTVPSIPPYVLLILGVEGGGINSKFTTANIFFPYEIVINLG